MKNSLKGLTGLLGTALISTACLTGCGKHEEPKDIYMIEGDSQPYTVAQSTEFTRITSIGNIANPPELDKGKTYGHNIKTGGVEEISEQKYRITHLTPNNNSFKEETQEPEKPAESDYITRHEFNNFSTDLVNEVEKVIDERFKAYFPEQQPSTTPYPNPQLQPAPEYIPQSNELMVPIEPSFPQTQRPRVNVDINLPELNIMDLPPARHRR